MQSMLPFPRLRKTLICAVRRRNRNTRYSTWPLWLWTWAIAVMWWRSCTHATHLYWHNSCKQCPKDEPSRAQRALCGLFHLFNIMYTLATQQIAFIIIYLLNSPKMSAAKTTHINVHQTANTNTPQRAQNFGHFRYWRAAAAAARKVLRFIVARCAKLIGVHVDVIT